MSSSYGNKERTNESSVSGTISVSTTAIELKIGASLLKSRDFVVIQPKNGSIFVGSTAAVTSSTGIEIKKNQTMHLAAGDNIPLYAIASSGTVDVRFMELA